MLYPTVSAWNNSVQLEGGIPFAVAYWLVVSAGILVATRRLSDQKAAGITIVLIPVFGVLSRVVIGLFGYNVKVHLDF